MLSVLVDELPEARTMGPGWAQTELETNFITHKWSRLESEQPIIMFNFFCFFTKMKGQSVLKFPLHLKELSAWSKWTVKVDYISSSH